MIDANISTAIAPATGTGGDGILVMSSGTGTSTVASSTMVCDSHIHQPSSRVLYPRSSKDISTASSNNSSSVLKKKAKLYVKHDYHDHSRDPLYLPMEGELSSDESNSSGAPRRGPRGGVVVAFPQRLYEMLKAAHKDGLDEAVGWQSHGRCFVIRDPRRFVDEVMPKFFKQSKLTSFQRQVNLYGFRRLTTGPDRGAYYHELFLRGRPDLIKRMVRIRVKGTGCKSAASPETEPNFYTYSTCEEGDPIPPSQPQRSVDATPPGKCFGSSSCPQGEKNWMEEARTQTTANLAISLSNCTNGQEQIHDASGVEPKKENSNRQAKASEKVALLSKCLGEIGSEIDFSAPVPPVDSAGPKALACQSVTMLPLREELGPSSSSTKTIAELPTAGRVATGAEVMRPLAAPGALPNFQEVMTSASQGAPMVVKEAVGVFAGLRTEQVNYKSTAPNLASALFEGNAFLDTTSTTTRDGVTPGMLPSSSFQQQVVMSEPSPLSCFQQYQPTLEAPLDPFDEKVRELFQDQLLPVSASSTDLSFMYLGGCGGDSSTVSVTDASMHVTNMDFDTSSQQFMV